MSAYPEMPSSTYRTLNGVKYFVRKFGLGNTVLEEELTPIPTEKIITVMKEDGTVDTVATAALKSKEVIK